MTIADTSAWIEFLRRTGSAAHRMFKDAFEADRLATTEPVAMEVLAGSRHRGDELELSRMLSSLPLVSVGGLATWESAALVNRACRAAGATPRSQLDCLISAVAIREDLPVLHADRDFDLIAKHTPLRLVATG